MVEDTNTCPRVVGLLFAGGGGDTFANPIGPILSKLKVHIVGCSATSNAAGAVRAQAIPLQKGGMASSRFLACKAAKESVETNLLAVAGIVGMGIGVGGSDSNAPAVEIYSTAEPSEIRSKLPVSLNSVPLKIIKTGTIHAL